MRDPKLFLQLPTLDPAQPMNVRFVSVRAPSHRLSFHLLSTKQLTALINPSLRTPTDSR
jgi:hypothetical protein